MRARWPRRSASRAAGAATSPTARPTPSALPVGDNPDFCRSALARYTPHDFIALVQRHGIAFHEKHKGQLFCDDSGRSRSSTCCWPNARSARCSAGNPAAVAAVRHDVRAASSSTPTAARSRAAQLVVATGGLSIPKIGATDFGYRLARQFGHAIVETRPALVPLTFDAAPGRRSPRWPGCRSKSRWRSTAARSACEFHEDLLFTHRGLSGPAILQISSYLARRRRLAHRPDAGASTSQAS